ncbi:MAG: ATP-binding protein, partial [Candidatus Limnocylindrales bacterium]
MRLKRLRLTDIQRHEDLDLEFAPGLTIIRGPNEAGKTTIERAIEYGLFRKVTAAGQDVEGLRRWGAAAEAAPTVRIDFVDDEGAPGSLDKVFAGAKG